MHFSPMRYILIIEAVSASVAQTAHNSVAAVCNGVQAYDSGTLYSTDMSLVESYAMTNNIFVTMLTESGCFDSVQACASRHQSDLGSIVVKTMFPWAIASVMLACWVLFFMPCACFRCCRRCQFFFRLSEAKSPRSFSLSTKIVVGIWTFLFLFGFCFTLSFGFGFCEGR